MPVGTARDTGIYGTPWITPSSPPSKPRYCALTGSAHRFAVRAIGASLGMTREETGPALATLEGVGWIARFAREGGERVTLTVHGLAHRSAATSGVHATVIVLQHTRGRLTGRRSEYVKREAAAEQCCQLRQTVRLESTSD